MKKEKINQFEVEFTIHEELKKLLKENKISDFKIERKETNVYDIFMTPIRCAEYINMNISILPSGMTMT